MDTAQKTAKISKKKKQELLTAAGLTHEELALIFFEMDYRLKNIEEQLKTGQGQYLAVMPGGQKFISSTPMSPEMKEYMNNHISTVTLRSAHTKLKNIYELVSWGNEHEGMDLEELNMRKDFTKEFS